MSKTSLGLFNLRVFLKESVYEKDNKKFTPTNLLSFRVDNINAIHAGKIKPEIDENITIEEYVLELLNNADIYYINIYNNIIEKSNIKNILIELVD